MLGSINVPFPLINTRLLRNTLELHSEHRALQNNARTLHPLHFVKLLSVLHFSLCFRKQRFEGTHIHKYPKLRRSANKSPFTLLHLGCHFIFGDGLSKDQFVTPRHFLDFVHGSPYTLYDVYTFILLNALIVQDSDRKIKGENRHLGPNAPPSTTKTIAAMTETTKMMPAPPSATMILNRRNEFRPLFRSQKRM